CLLKVLLIYLHGMHNANPWNLDPRYAPSRLISCDILHLPTSYDTARIGISMCGMIDRSSSKFIGLFICQIPPVTRIQNTKRKHRSRTDAENLPWSTSALRINIVKSRATLVPSSQHHTYKITHIKVLSHPTISNLLQNQKNILPILSPIPLKL
ncbi:hypothetical protein ALC57_06632, partial [Trachymyrmex cornetzi]